MSGLATLANTAWFAVNARGYRQFRRALRNVRTTQSSILMGYLQSNSQTDFGRRWGFSKLRSAEQYRDQVPLSTYEDYVDSIKRIAAGEEKVLTHEPIRLFELSSGSTQASKWIPYTAGLQAEMRRAVAPWVFDLAKHQPTILRGSAYWSISPALRVEGAEASRVPVGFDTDSAYLGGLFKHLVDATLAVPAHVAHIKDIDQFRRATLLYLLRATDLRLISVWHPSFLTLLWSFLEENWGTLLDDLRHGIQLLKNGVQIAAAPRRAHELSHLGSVAPNTIWPHLQLISCWGDGHASMALSELSQQFPGCQVQAKGLIATEGFVSLPFSGEWPLAVNSHYFEFLDTSGTTHFSWELSQGKQYSVILTTAGGLYRYQLQDVIEVTGFLEEAPCIRFLHKENHISDLCGEKLNESFVASVVLEVLQSAHLSPAFVILAARHDHSQTQYVLYLEIESTSTFDFECMSSDLEKGLRRNPHYKYCVDLHQLRPAAIALTAPGAFERYSNRMRHNGQKLGDIKPMVLSNLTDWDRWLCDQVHSA